MNAKKTVLVVGFIAFLKSLSFATDVETGRQIHHRGKKDYVWAVQAARITEKEAGKILRDAVKNKNDVYFDSEPLFFVNGEYFFGVPQKDRVPLTGYYVNAANGAVVFRKSKFTISSSDKRLPPKAFESEQSMGGELK